jgi:ketosteroid isomerase-like protein
MTAAKTLAYQMHEAFNNNDFDVVDEIFAPDFFSHPLGTTGPAEVKAAWQAVRARHPELRTVVEDVVVDGDRVAMRSTLHGARGTVMEIFRVAGGRIAELWGVTSLAELRATPRQDVEELLRRTADGPTEDMADLFAEDAVFEFPFLPPDAGRPEQDRESFRAHLKDAVAVEKFEGMDDVHLHETADPEVVVAEYLLHGRVLATGERFMSRVVMVARVRNGLITWSRSYSKQLDLISS